MLAGSHPQEMSFVLTASLADNRYTPPLKRIPGSERQEPFERRRRAEPELKPPIGSSALDELEEHRRYARCPQESQPFISGDDLEWHMR